MLWPDDPADSKSLLLSLIGGLSVSIIIVFADFLIAINDKKYATVIELFVTIIICFISLVYFVSKYKCVRAGLDMLDIHNKKKK